MNAGIRDQQVHSQQSDFLGAVAGHCVAVIEVAVFRRAEFDLPIVVNRAVTRPSGETDQGTQSRLATPSDLTRRGELNTVSN